MKIVSAAALLALATFASAGQVSNDLSNENIRDADAVLKEHAQIDPAMELAADDIDVCDAKTHVLLTCFDEAEEADSIGCWEDCVVPASVAFDACDDFCNAVEQCRRGKCSSGPDCASPYYDVLNCVLEDSGEGAEECTCTGSLESLESLEDAPVEEEAGVVPATGEEAVDDDACEADTQDLIKCFNEANEANMNTCWEDCVIPASEAFATCDGFCTSVEQCRSEKCSSGPTCAAQYQKVLECVLEGPETEGCSCTELYKQEEFSPAVTSIEVAEEDVCSDETQVLIDCFDKNEEADILGCWEECTIPASLNVNFDADTCDSFCASVEQCRRESCSSGFACASTFYDVLNCVMAGSDESSEECTCGGTVEADAAAGGSCASGDGAETCIEA